MDALDQEMKELKARATWLEQSTGNETDRAMKLARLAELTALRNQITELMKSKGNFLFLRVEFLFSP